MGRKHSAKALINYALFAFVVFLAYKVYFEDKNQQGTDHLRKVSKEHPKNIQHRQVINEDNQEDTANGNDGAKAQETKDDNNDEGGAKKGDLSWDLKQNGGDANQQEHNQEQVKEQTDNKINQNNNEQKKKKKKYTADGTDWDLEEEMQRRRAEYYKKLENMSQEIGPHEQKNIEEHDDHVTFVSAGSHSTFHATIQFIYSVQYFYEDSQIAIYDIGLTSQEKAFIASLCNTIVVPMFLKYWPESLYKIRHRIWRSLVLQFATARFGHFVYLEPGRYIYHQVLKDYLKQSRVHGAIFAGIQQKYSPYFVTNKHMYSFIPISEHKLQKTPFFELTLAILHNTKRVQHHFMRYLTCCTLEEYCIAPPGAQPNCDHYTWGRKYGQCHKFDESAINLILNKWHNYSPKEYFMKDKITKKFEGGDVTNKLMVCKENNGKGEM